tara:strand:- start:38 stop:430 length:393 start_codon:yes stop_codon:yes gene_type:complete
MEVLYRVNPFATRAEAFSNWHTVAEEFYLKASTNPRQYERDLTELNSITYEYNGETYTASDYFSKANLTGLIVLSDGKVVAENYNQGVNDEITFHLWSASKSFISKNKFNRPSTAIKMNADVYSKYSTDT